MQEIQGELDSTANPEFTNKECLEMIRYRVVIF